jgi:hypothetical protein
MNEQPPLTETALLERIALGEHTRQQFKRSFNNPDALAAELAAFANSGGGTLLIGVNDDGSLAGLDAAELRRLNQFTASVQRPQAQGVGAGEQVTDPVTGQVTEQVTEQVTQQVRRLCVALEPEALGTKDLMQSLGLKHRPSFLEGYLTPALKQHLVEMTQPDSPRSPTQKYRLTAQGKALLK